MCNLKVSFERQIPVFNSVTIGVTKISLANNTYTGRGVVLEWLRCARLRKRLALRRVIFVFFEDIHIFVCQASGHTWMRRFVIPYCCGWCVVNESSYTFNMLDARRSR